MIKKSILFIFLFFATNLYSQNIRIGEWRSHLAYNDGLKVTEKGDSIFCATKTGLFVFDKQWNQLRGLSKVDGFSDIATTTVRYYSKYQKLFIAYQNTNIDIVDANNKIRNVPDIMRKGDILGIKEITDFNFYNEFCFISTTFGIVKYNILKNEITEDYREIGPNGAQISINDITFYKDSIYAASSIGILSASLAPNINLRDYRSWKFINTKDCLVLDTFNNKLWASFASATVPQLFNYDTKSWQPVVTQNEKAVTALENNHGKLVITSDDGITLLNQNNTHRYAQTNGQLQGILGKDNKIWIAKSFYGMISVNENNELGFYKPNGPYGPDASSIYNHKDEIWVASGGASVTWGPLFTNNGIYRFKGNEWKNYNEFSVEGFRGYQSVMSVAVHPETEHIWASSFVHGLIEIDNDKIVDIYNGYDTKALQNPSFDTSRKHVKLVGLTFDQNNNLWTTNFSVPRPIVVRTNTGQFHSFDIGSSGGNNDMTYLVTDDYNQVWAAHPSEGVVVYNHNGTFSNEDDDKVRRYKTGTGSGNLPSNDILTLTKDMAGQIWIGTSNGLAVVYDPSLAFSKNNSDAQQIWIKNGKLSGYLLSGEAVTAIAIDGGNRKWIGTRRGVWVTDSAGTKILGNFNTKNSPLVSDNIRCMGINGATGEVFIGTDKGIVSYRTDATLAPTEYTDVYAFPNPVRPGYEGVIAIKGLVKSSIVKITDITGNLVYETKSEGGTATWNGRNFNGEKANSGVYLVFCSDTDGTQTAVTKIMIVR